MLGSAYNRGGPKAGSAPSHFKDSARSAIYQELPPTASSATSVRSAPTLLQPRKWASRSSYHSSASSVFSASKRSVRSAPSLYSSSAATIPEDSEPLTATVEQLINDIELHERMAREAAAAAAAQSAHGTDPPAAAAAIPPEAWQISLGSPLQYQPTPEPLIDWNLNVTRAKLFLVALPAVSSTDLHYSAMPQLVGDLAYSCHVTLVPATVSDKELIHTLFASNLYEEHDLDARFRRSVAEISVKQSRLLQISAAPRGAAAPITAATAQDAQTSLRLEFQEIMLRNYLVNLAAAATTAHEYKLEADALKRSLRDASGKKQKLPKDQKKFLWERVRSDVFRRAGLE
ncbi:Uncharacterized protein ABC855_g3840 [[Candida] zeylanoides]